MLPFLGGRRKPRWVGGKLPINNAGLGSEWDVVALVVSPSPDLNGQVWHLVRGDGLTGNFIVLEKPSLVVPVQDDAIFDVNGIPMTILYVSGSGAVRPVTARDAALSLISSGVVIKCMDPTLGVLTADETVDYVVSKVISEGGEEGSEGEGEGGGSITCTASNDLYPSMDAFDGGALVTPIDNTRLVVLPIKKSVLNDLVFRSALDRHVTASASNYPALLQAAVDIARAKTQQLLASNVRPVIIMVGVLMFIVVIFLLGPQLAHGLSSILGAFHLPRPP